MSENAGGSNNTLYFIVGGLVVIIAALGYMYFGGHMPGTAEKMSITIEAPKAP